MLRPRLYPSGAERVDAALGAGSRIAASVVQALSPANSQGLRGLRIGRLRSRGCHFALLRLRALSSP
eukprot:10076883-Alexandrium_andersonii.AAC.1